MERDYIALGDSAELIKKIPDGSIDLIVMDPPYLINNTKAGGHSELSKSIQGMNDEIEANGLTKGFDISLLDEVVRVMKTINIYIWCNAIQIPDYIDYFVRGKQCNFDFIIWNKTNAMPLYSNKYLTDKEYCLYFRKGGYCAPPSYENARTVFYQPINAADKKLYGHPTIKPLNIIKTLIENSSQEGDVVFDPFVGSGTTCVAAASLGRHYIGFELKEDYYNIALRRISEVGSAAGDTGSSEYATLPGW